MIDPELRAKIVERFPAYAWIADVPEIAGLLQEAIDKDLTPDTLAARIKGTEWWKTRTDKARQWADIEATDPSTATQKVNETKSIVHKLAATLGGDISDEMAGGLAWRFEREGWNEEQLRTAIAAQVNPKGVPAVSVNALAKQYMINLSPSQADDYTRRLFAGQLDEQSLRGLFQAQASSQFPHMADLIGKGVVPGDYFSAYTSMIAKMTDRSADDIDLTEPKWQTILSTNDNGTLRPMTLAEARRYVRSTDDFANSTQGRQEAAAFTTQISQALGAR